MALALLRSSDGLAISLVSGLYIIIPDRALWTKSMTVSGGYVGYS